jgi:hypothetical protein
MGRPFDQGLPPPPPIVPIPTPLPEGNNPIAERDGCGLPICTPGECLPICTPGARNTTAAPTNGTTALPRAFLRKLIQAGYRVVPPAKYGGPPEQAMNRKLCTKTAFTRIQDEYYIQLLPKTQLCHASLRIPVCKGVPRSAKAPLSSNGPMGPSATLWTRALQA